jgi:hypothetical protein
LEIPSPLFLIAFAATAYDASPEYAGCHCNESPLLTPLGGGWWDISRIINITNANRRNLKSVTLLLAEDVLFALEKGHKMPIVGETHP